VTGTEAGPTDVVVGPASLPAIFKADRLCLRRDQDKKAVFKDRRRDEDMLCMARDAAVAGRA